MKLKTNLMVSSLMLLTAVLTTSCSSTTTSDSNNNLSTSLVIEKAAPIPVLDGQATSSGVYVRNTSGKAITDITYAVVNANNNNQNLAVNASACRNIAAHSSCLLPITTPALQLGNSGANIIVASYDGQQSKQLINYRYTRLADYSGVNFSDNSQSLYGTNDYATSYVFVGNGQSQTNVGFNTSNNSLAIISGLTNGKVDIPAKSVMALELQSNQNVTSNLVTVTPYTVTTSKGFTAALQLGAHNNSQLQVTITPQQQANLLMSNVGILSASESTATLTLMNNGNKEATTISLNSSSTVDVAIDTAQTNPCGATLAVGASCNYKLKLLNQESNGNVVLTLGYNNAIGNVQTLQSVYYFNNRGAPMVIVAPTQSSFTEQVSTNQNILFKVENIGGSSLNNTIITPLKNGLTNTALTLQNNTCGSTLAAESCQFSVNVAASGLIDSGVIYANVTGRAGTTNYSFMSKSVATTITDPTAPSVTSTTPQNTQTSVRASTAIVVNFSEAMKPITLNTTNIMLQKVSDSSLIPLTLQGVTNNNQTVTFTQTSGKLVGLTNYRIVINPSQIQDVNGNALDAGQTESTIATFTTGDTTAPSIVTVNPTNGATNQSRTPTMNITFSESMDQTTLSTSNILLKNESGVLATGYTTSYESTTNTVTINLNSNPLSETTTYRIILNESAITDTSGNALGSDGNYVATQFTTGDFTAPTLSSTIPVNGATNVAVESGISLTFSESMDTSTLTTTNIKLKKASDNSNISLGTPSYSNGNRTVSLNPTANLADGESYNIVINPSLIKDVAGNAMGVATSQTVSSFNVVSGSNMKFVWLPPELVAEPGTTGLSAKLIVESGTLSSSITLTFITSDARVTVLPNSCTIINNNSTCDLTIGVESSVALGSIISVTANNPYVPALYIKISSMRAYIVNNESSNISICKVLGSGALGACSTDNASGTLNNPNGIFFYSQKVYITNQSSNTISICNVNQDGSFAGCVTNTLGSLLSFPTGINISNNKIYVTSQNNNSITICPVNTLVDCYNVTNITFSGPYGIAFNSGYAYIANVNNNTISVCQVDVNGNISANCSANIGTGFSAPTYPVFYNNHVYVNNMGPTSICSLSGYNIGTCTTSSGNDSSGQALITYAWDIKFFNGYAYITNDDSYNGDGKTDSVVICPTINNIFGVCTQKLDNSFQHPYGIAFYTP